MVPELNLVTQDGAPYSLREAVAQHDPYVLLPFRGHW